ncbi:MAG TPA: hypothetical protein VK855_01770 [Thioalkalivibrio sp.]|nr:hypothetical protein [Thioalkalivibrio sp.]
MGVSSPRNNAPGVRVLNETAAGSRSIIGARRDTVPVEKNSRIELTRVDDGGPTAQSYRGTVDIEDHAGVDRDRNLIIAGVGGGLNPCVIDFSQRAIRRIALDGLTFRWRKIRTAANAGRHQTRTVRESPSHG